MELYGQEFDLENPKSTFFHGDCIEGMKAFPDGYFDLAVCDPPYGDALGGGGSQGTRLRFHAGSVWNKYLETETAPSEDKEKLQRIEWDTAPPKEYFEELFRVSKNQIIWGGNYFGLPPTRCFLIWRKLTISESFSMAMAEYAWTSFNANAKVYEIAPQDPTGNRFHPTQKPVNLYEWVLNNFSGKKDLILDTHVGSGSSLIACRNTNHKYVGFEIDNYYYEKAKERIEKETAQMNIYDLLKNCGD